MHNASLLDVTANDAVRLNSTRTRNFDNLNGENRLSGSTTVKRFAPKSKSRRVANPLPAPISSVEVLERAASRVGGSCKFASRRLISGFQSGIILTHNGER